ncbi:MAG: DUF3604 domain-containing protein [Gammaproteobacteria bacterium]|nr:MAG: DUF3604 domain-containing protein [Gammaproteobacteria bacterium]
MDSIKKLFTNTCHSGLTIAVGSLIFISSPTNADYVGSILGNKADIKQGLNKKPVKESGYSPYAGTNYPTKVLWGDTHLHTNLSLDARAFGVTLGPAEAYRLARGEEISTSLGDRVKLSRPLDWLVVADHSDAMGAMDEVVKGNPTLMKDPKAKDWNERINKGGDTALAATMEIIETFAGISGEKIPAALTEKTFVRSVWERYIDTAEKFNEPGRFSTLIGYEWTSTDGGNNLHRNVIYRDGGKQAKQLLPYTTEESFNPEDLWKWMARYEEKTQGKVLALAHNGNLSNGIMFPEINPATGKPLSNDYAKTRARWEPLYEATQIKGDGESHPYLSPNDEYAGHDVPWDKSNLGPVAKKKSMLQYEYAREALKNGLKLEAKLGTNPYKFGMLGSTDSHTSLATAEEDNFYGKHTGTEPTDKRANKLVAEFGEIKYYGWEMVSSGYAAVWAEENTREAIWDALQRKEVYATTGPRMTVRFFGGWDFSKADAQHRAPALIGYSKGVPMGGDLKMGAKGKSPTFLVAALKDLYSGNLDRIQIIKGWLDKDGKTHEKVYDVTWSGDRKPDAKGKLPPVGNTVDVKNASWTNTIGAAELITVWKDPDFNPQQRAFYYVRVIEIPTPRWTAYDAKRFNVKMDKNVPMMTTERAYTSPIWYTPSS